MSEEPTARELIQLELVTLDTSADILGLTKRGLLSGPLKAGTLRDVFKTTGCRLFMRSEVEALAEARRLNPPRPGRKPKPRP